LRAAPFPLTPVFPKVASRETMPLKDSTMNTRNRTDYSYYDTIDAAKLRAERLREEAISEFWSGSGEAARRAQRSARRFASALARHARLRGQSRA
jgi:hypothetical protein